MIRIELVKQTRRMRTWLTLGVMAAIPALLTVVIGLTRASRTERITLVRVFRRGMAF